MVLQASWDIGTPQPGATGADLDENAFSAQEEHNGLSTPPEDPIPVVHTQIR